MKKYLIFFIASLLCTSFIAPIYAQTELETNSIIEETFSVPTQDGLAKIHGTISFPATQTSKKFVPIIIVGGTNTSRDGYPYVSLRHKSRENFAQYRALAHQLTREGFAVIRFDLRGLMSLFPCEKQEQQNEVDKHPYTPEEYIQHCYNKSEAMTNTFYSKNDDIMSVFNWVRKDTRLDFRKYLLIAHSEAVFHVSHLIHLNKLSPLNLILVGAPTETPYDQSLWQLVEQPYERTLAVAKKNGGYISNTDVEDLYHDWICSNPSMSSNDGGYSMQTMSQLRDNLVRRYYYIMLDLYEYKNHPTDRMIDNALDIQKNITVGMTSFKHFTEFAENKTNNVLRDLRSFKGHVSFVWGSLDQFVPIQREIISIRSNKKMIGHTSITLINRRLHDIFVSDLGIKVVVAESLRLYGHGIEAPQQYFIDSIFKNPDVLEIKETEQYKKMYEWTALEIPVKGQILFDDLYHD